MAYEYYEVAKEVARKMKEENYAEWGDRILNAMRAGSTVTEILMALQWNLKKFYKEESSCSEEIKKTIIELLKQINIALK